MNILFLCKASVKIGLGHLVRSRSLAVGLKGMDSSINLDFILVGDRSFDKLLLSLPFEAQIVNDEEEVVLKKKYDVAFLDMSRASAGLFGKIRNNAGLTVSLSPVFNRINEVDVLFNRTKYLPERELPGQVYAGMEYSIIRDGCVKIGAGLYEENLRSPAFPIGISMGGGDAANKTLIFLKSLKKCAVPATFWVLLGEGYKHSYNDLINEIKADTSHEIILVNANRSIWHILKNCLLLILPGGITSHEAVFAGLPSINFLEDENHFFLIKELVENNACFYGGRFKNGNLSELNKKIEYLYNNRNILLEMHVKSKNLIDGNSFARIHRIISDKVKSVRCLSE